MSKAFRMIAACMFTLLFALAVDARPIGGQFPRAATRCNCGLSLTEANQRMGYRADVKVDSSTGPTLEFVASYNSIAADGSQSRTATVMGYGWTHSYNVLLFAQRGSMFRMDFDGRVTEYALGANRTYTATPGYFETLVRNPDGTFTLRDKHGTTQDFALVPGTPFLVEGPVYRLMRVTDRNDNVTTLTYAAGLLTQVTDTYGHSLAFSYAGDNLGTVTDPAGRITRFAYDATGTLLTAITDADGHATRYSYNALGQMTQAVDPDGRITTFQYANQKPAGIRDGAGASVLRITNPNNWATDETALATSLLRIYQPSTVTRVDGRGNAWRYDYDSHGYVTRAEAPDGAVTRYTYDPATLQVATVTDANTHTTSYRYDAQGNLVQVTDALGFVTSFTYEPVFNMMTTRTDANGRITRYQYDAHGNRVAETDPLGGVRAWTYDSHGNVLTARDKNGNLTTYAYDAFGNRTGITDAVGNTYSMTYDAVGNRITLTNPRAFTTAYQYDGLNRLVRMTDAFGKATQFLYDGRGHPVRVTDRNGRVTRHVYDLRERQVQTIDALGNVTRYAYDGNNNRVSFTDPNAHVTRYAYDVRDRLARIVDALGNVTTMTYDAVGNQVAQTDANGHARTSQYDALNRLVHTTDGAGNQLDLVYDGVGVPGCAACTGPTRGSRITTARVDGEGRVIYYKYDGLDRPIIEVRKQTDVADVIDADDAVSRYAYDAQDNMLSAREPNGNTETYLYDAVNRLTRMTDAAGDVTAYAYDANSNVLAVTTPNLDVTRYTWDALDRLALVDDSLGRAASFIYDAVGNMLAARDGNGNGVAYAYDAAYRVTGATDALGNLTRYAYDAAGNVVSKTDREARVTRYVYDAVDRRTRVTDALGNRIDMRYDGVGNLTRVTDANLHATDYAYDGADRLVQEAYADGRLRSYAYDAADHVVSRTDQKGQTTRYLYNDLYYLVARVYPASAADHMTYDLSGRLLSAERGGWIVTLAYDGADRVSQTMQNGRAVTYAYDVPGRTRTVGYPGGRTVVETFDARNRLVTSGDAGASPALAQYAYDLGNRVVKRSYRNGTATTYAYNANDWITSLDHRKGALRVNGSAYAFDREGTKRFEQKLVDGAGSDARSEAYAYDATYRLVDYRVGTLVGNTVPAPLTRTQYTLDAVGNWTQTVKDGVPQSRMHDATNAITQIGSTAVFSDDNGNTAEDGVFRYAYDEENRLVALTRIADARVVGRYEYDALGRRVKKIADPGAASSPVETRYFYDSLNLVEEQSNTGSTLGTWIYGDALDDVLAMTRGAQAYFFHENSLGSIEVVTDAAGAAVERYAYDAYGATVVSDGAGIPLSPNAWGTARSAVGNPWIFTARQLDEESGLTFYRARHYDSGKGRFLQRDPVGYVDGMNLYEYVGAHPTMARDALGRELRVGGKALNNGSEFYRKMAQNDFYKQVLDKMIASKETFRRTSESELELELKMRDAFVKCMEKHRGQGAGCQYGPKYPWTPSKMWDGNAYKGKSPSAALDAFQNGVPDKATGLIESSELDCYSMGNLCLWIALRDALGAEKFDARFKDKRIVITQEERVYVMALRRNVFATPYLRDSTEMLPGDFVQFHNHPDYLNTRQKDAGRRYSSENAVYVGVRDREDKFCGFGIPDIVTREKMMQELLDDYNAGAVPGTPKRTLDNTKINIGNLRRPNPAFTLP